MIASIYRSAYTVGLEAQLLFLSKQKYSDEHTEIW